jgi:hypothetical protein
MTMPPRNDTPLAKAPQPLSRSPKQASEVPLKVLKESILHLKDACDFINGTIEDHKDAEAFHSIVDWAVRQCEVEPVALAKAFDSNTGTVSRWRTGKNAPHPRERPRIIAWIKEAIKAHAQDLESELARRQEERDAAQAKLKKDAEAAGRRHKRRVV